MSKQGSAHVGHKRQRETRYPHLSPGQGIKLSSLTYPTLRSKLWTCQADTGIGKGGKGLHNHLGLRNFKDEKEFCYK